MTKADSSILPGGVRAIDAAVAIGGTMLMGAICQRATIVLDSVMPLAGLFAVPVALSARSLVLSFSSLLAVALFAFSLLLLQPEHTLDWVAFVFDGLVLMAAAAVCSIVAGGRLRDTRAALAAVRGQSRRTMESLNNAGVCVVVLDRNLTWLSASDAAWRAFGVDMQLRTGAEARVELDDEAASALMQSSSREAWRRLLETVKADVASATNGGGTKPSALPPRLATLYTQAGEGVLHRFTVTAGANGELVFVGVPLHGLAEESPDSGVTLTQWLASVAESIDQPAVILQADGCLLATNAQFDTIVGKREPGARIYDIEQVKGVDEAAFASRIWSATRRGAVALPQVSLGRLEGVGARLVPPGAPHTEAVLLMFHAPDEPVPPSFEQHTGPGAL